MGDRPQMPNPSKQQITCTTIFERPLRFTFYDVFKSVGQTVQTGEDEQTD